MFKFKNISIRKPGIRRPNPCLLAMCHVKSSGGGGGGGGLRIIPYMDVPDRYVLPDRVWFLRISSL